MKIFILAVLVLLAATCESKPTGPESFLSLVPPLGKHTGVNGEGIQYEKSYYLTNFVKLNSANARSFCKSFGPNVDLASFDSLDEFNEIKTKLETKLEAFGQEKNKIVFVGGFNLKSEYRWISSGAKVSVTNVQPTAELPCLAVSKKKNQPKATFTPVSCDEELKFVCEVLNLKYDN